MEPLVRHYHGPVVRKLFLTGAVIIMVTVPFFQGIDIYPLWLSIFAIILLALGAAFTSRENRWSTTFDLAVAALNVTIFEYNAVNAYASAHYAYFTVSQVLALIFLLALYYAARTTWGVFRALRNQQAGY
ncbi:MAG TPA: hypothetical protein VMT99_01225 [Candidatus Paceibacterota bacterium]|nr:hypothetical protein [Candidatus Paceibacterota bacterium]